MINKQKTSATSAILSEVLAKLEVDVVGIARLAEWEGTKLEETALSLLPGAKSVVVFAMEYSQEVLDLTSIERIMGAPPLNELMASEANYLAGRMTKAAYDLAKASRNIGLKALSLPSIGCPQDARFLKAIFSYKHAAQAAGLGKLGWHSLLITPDFGPRVRLSCCLTEVELEPTNTETSVECDGCGICLESCPACALTEPQANEQYAINKFACRAFRNAAGDCCECMRVCPIGR